MSQILITVRTKKDMKLDKVEKCSINMALVFFCLSGAQLSYFGS